MKNKIRKKILTLSDSKLLNLHNEFCDSCQNEKNIYENKEGFFNDYYSNNTMEAVRAAVYGKYRITDTYLKIDGHANLNSFNSILENVSIEDLVEYAIENDCVLY
jgi:hypothetical protein